MRSSFVSAAVLAFASMVYAQTPGFNPISSPYQDESIAAGQPFDIVWEPSKNYTGTVTIQLLQGATPSTLSTGDVVQAGVDGSAGTYTWNVPTSLPYFATYGFIMTLDSNTTIFQYSFPFHLTGLSSSSISASGTTSGSTTSTVTMHLGTGTAYTSSTPTNSTTSSFVSKQTSSASLSTSVSTKASTSSKTSSTSSSSTSSSTPNAAVAQVATGSLAMIGGFVLALAL